MVLSCTDDFEVTWSDPADAELTWGHDVIHMSRPFPPLAQAFGPRLCIPVRPDARVIFLNGYAYVLRPGSPPSRPEPRAQATDSAPASDRWNLELVPELERICEQLREEPASQK